jgi:hypothetical protein
MKSNIKNIAVFLLSVSFCLAVNAQEIKLYRQFVNPPSESRPRVWWHWMNGNITKDGIYKDILWMNRAGIGGFHSFDAGMVTPQIVDKRLMYMDAGWQEAFGYATHLADSLGMEMAVASAPGWSSTGGTWVQPENAMKKLTWHDMIIKGGKRLSVKLPDACETTGFFQNIPPSENSSTFASSGAEDKYYKDIAVIAVRLSKAEKTMAEMNAGVTSSGGNFSVEQLTDGDLANAVLLPRDDRQGYAWIQYEFKKPQIIKALSIVDGNVRNEWFCAPATVLKYLEVSDDGTMFHRVCEIPHGGAARQTIDIPVTTAKFFRVVFDNPVVEDLYAELNGIKAVKATPVSELVLYPVSKINHAEEKAGFATPHDMMDNMTPAETDVSLLTDVVDVTDKVDAQGNLTWNVPKGDWKIYRFGYSLTGKKNHPAPPEATGLEVDKLDADAVKEYMENYLDMYRNASGGMMGQRGLQYLLIDSYEAGWETWTTKMAQEFEKRRGYSLLKWLPVLTGQIIESTEKSEQFLWDWRKTIGELIADNLYGQVEKTVKQHGMKCYFESHENGRMYLVDGMEAKKNADIPMAAIWAVENAGGANHKMSECDIRESASVAHVYGQNIVAGESFTSNGLENRAYSFYPGNLKPVADFAMACGLNRFVIHESAHQPVDDRKPGVGLYIFGQWFNRHETWAEQAKAWTDYLSRSSYMLQQGRYIADVLYFYGEDNCITGLFAHHLPDIPNGYSFDYVNADALQNMISFDGNNLVTKSGMKYRLLALDKNARTMSLPVLRKIAELVGQGAVICGQKPEYEPTMNGDKTEFRRIVNEIWNSGRKNVQAGKSIAEVLNIINIPPDFICEDMHNLKFVHRSTSDSEIYWVNNRTDNARTLDVTFRVSGLKPELWHPETGKTEDVSYSVRDGKTAVRLNLVANDAVFVVFSGKVENVEVKPVEKKEILFRHIDTPWTVNFQKNMGAPEKATFDRLISYTKSEDDGIKYFSGTAIYKNTILVSAPELKQGRFVMDLGKVGNVAEVIVNGMNLGILWKAPYTVDITNILKSGTNNIEIKVTNLWVNRLVGDMQPDCKQKYTYTAFPFYKADSPLLPSGLMGPVDIFVIQDNPLPYHSIKPGRIWLDTNGESIQAHGFQILEKNGTYYWYGENKEFTTRGSHVWTYGIRCYKSDDFYNWEDCGLIIEPDTVNPLSPLHYSQSLDRPHIIYCKQTGKYVCWIKSMDEDGYFIILQADDLLGKYEYVRSLKPQGYGVGDFDLYVDEDTGKGYVWFERPHWELICSELTDDYTGVTPRYSTHFTGMRPPYTREAPTHFVYDGKHYLFTSGTTGYYPNLSMIASFSAYHGKYTDLGNPHPTDKYKHSFCSQITDVVRIPGKDLYVAVADRWMPQIADTDEPAAKAKQMIPKYEKHEPFPEDFNTPEPKDKQNDVRSDWDVTYNATYVFLPIVFRKGIPHIEWKDEWRIEDYK